MINDSSLSEFIKKQSRDAGFDSCGIARARDLAEYRTLYEEWLKNNHHAEMEYMNRNIEKRFNPSLIVENAKSVIVFLQNYYPSEPDQRKDYKISKYAYGTDYHFVLKNKIHNIFNNLKQYFGNITGRVFVDSAPVMEKLWAVEAGLGWIGKNSLLIAPNAGSYFFIGVLIVDIEMTYDNPYSQNFCGNCTKCIDSCPGNALLSNKTIDAQKCVSYITIEQKDDATPQKKKVKTNFIFGCDICQDVCPWNTFSKQTTEPDFLNINTLVRMSNEELMTINEETFMKNTTNSPIARCGYRKFKMNIENVTV